MEGSRADEEYAKHLRSIGALPDAAPENIRCQAVGPFGRWELVNDHTEEHRVTIRWSSP